MTELPYGYGVICLSVTWAMIGAIIINLLPHVNLQKLDKSEIPPLSTNKQYRFGFFFLVIVGMLTDLVYCLDGKIPGHLNSALIGAAAPSILTNLLKTFKKSNDTNEVG